MVLRPVLLRVRCIATLRVMPTGQNEAFSRVLIDKALEFSGWNLIESTRDKVMHGSEPTEAVMRRAIADVLDYAKEFNEFVKTLAVFPPFGDLRGFHGRGSRLNPATTRLVLKGLGFNLA